MAAQLALSQMEEVWFSQGGGIIFITFTLEPPVPAKSMSQRVRSRLGEGPAEEKQKYMEIALPLYLNRTSSIYGTWSQPSIIFTCSVLSELSLTVKNRGGESFWHDYIETNV